MFVEVVGERETQAGAVEAFGDALADGDGHGDGGFRREAEEGAHLVGIEALHGAAVEAGRLDGQHELGGGQRHALVDPSIAGLGSHLPDVVGDLVAVIAGGAVVALRLEVGDHGGRAVGQQIGAADQEDELGGGGCRRLGKAGLDGLCAER